MKDGKLHHDYNYFGVEHTNIAGPEPIAAGKHTIKFEFKIDSPKPGTGGTSTLFVDGKEIAVSVCRINSRKSRIERIV